MLRLTAALAVLVLLLAGCGSSAGDDRPPPLVIGGIPDQDVAVLEQRFGGIAEYLSAEAGIPVRYQPSVDYAAVVTGFSNGDIKLGWFGGLTGVQARLDTPGARAVVQRPIDTRFRSVFVVRAGDPARRIEDLAGRSFTFGSESSTSGHLMPRYFLTEAGLDPETRFNGRPGFSGSHDKTWKLVEAGSFQAGVLSTSVWDRAVKQRQVDTTRVRELARTPTYFDYHWVAHPEIDETYGPGTTDRLVQALLRMDKAGPEAQRTLQQFEDTAFVPTEDANYGRIEQVARSLGLIKG